jgi:hypothetical protein
MFVKLFRDYTLFSILLEVEENQMAETTTVGNQQGLSYRQHKLTICKRVRIF